MRFLAFFLGIFLALGSMFTSCTPEVKPGPLPKNIPLAKVLILCEGNFLWENAQLDVWLPDSQILISNAYEKQNNKPLGDVLQSGLFADGKLWLSINNSGKILELDPKSLVEINKNISQNYPRYLAYSAGQQSIFITDLKKNLVRELDAQNLNPKNEYPVLPQKTGEFSGWTEQIVEWNQKIVAANVDGNLLIIDPVLKNKKLLAVDSGAQFLTVDKQNQLWVISNKGNESVITQVSSDESTNVYRFIKSIQRISLGVNKDTLWLLTGNDVHFIDLTNTGSKFKMNLAFNVNQSQNSYALGVHPQTGDFYIGDARDYVSAGKVYIYNSEFKLTKTIETGVIPTNFVFVGF